MAVALLSQAAVSLPCCRTTSTLQQPRSSAVSSSSASALPRSGPGPVTRLGHEVCNSFKASFAGDVRQLTAPVWTVRQGCASGYRPVKGKAVIQFIRGINELSTDFRKTSPKDTNVVIVGATGYIGKFVVKEMVKRGYNVIAVARAKSGIGAKAGKEQTQKELEGATVCFSDVTDAVSLRHALEATQPNVDVVISCLASRGGGVKDSWLVDYTATKNSLEAGRALGASHFVLLSAICVQKPLLEFQKAKLKFEEELQSVGEGFTYSIVRPTAFFKSLGGQVKSVQGGGPYVMFGDGTLTACKPISEADLASFIADCVSDEGKINQILPIGGPGKALTPLAQGEMLFNILGYQPRFIKVPIQIMDFVIGQLDFWKQFFPNLEDPAEFGKIGRYYAAESMLVLNPETGKYDEDATPSYGKDTLEEFFERVVRDGMADQAVF